MHSTLNAVASTSQSQSPAQVAAAAREKAFANLTAAVADERDTVLARTMIIKRRKELADYYLWHDGRGIYVDWNCAKGRQSLYDSVTTFWPMWCGMASEAQAEKIMCVGNAYSPIVAPFCRRATPLHRRQELTHSLRIQEVLSAQVRGRRRPCLGHGDVARPHLAAAPQPSVGVRRCCLSCPHLAFKADLCPCHRSYPAAWPPQCVDSLPS